MKKIDIASYKIVPSIKLSDLKTSENLDSTDKELKKSLEKLRKDLGDFQNVLYAHGKYAVLICLQGMDTSGKDSLVREVFKDCNVRGVETYSFKVPTELELDHDYLWRHYIALPPKGKFGVFNRTHYENVLVTKVHPEYILNENIPNINTVADIDQDFWNKRYEQITNFEQHISDNGILVFKFFLNISKEEQRQRLLRRLRLQQKNWKFSPGDLKERTLWNDYQQCYEEAINNTSTSNAPWFVIPSDNKNASRLIVATILLESLKKYKDIKEPELDDKIKANIEIYKSQLEKEQ
jgi:PPK2 family polyphosphate:nucleotide phosphotransferase